MKDLLVVLFFPLYHGFLFSIIFFRVVEHLGYFYPSLISTFAGLAGDLVDQL